MSHVLSPIIELPVDDDLLRAQLVHKLGEYCHFLGHPPVAESEVEPAPREVSPDEVDVIYRIKILVRLLEKRRVDFLELKEEIEEWAGTTFNWELFKKAYGVIHEYVVDGGKDVDDGTGLASPYELGLALGGSELEPFPPIPKLSDLPAPADSDTLATVASESASEAGAEED